MHIKQRYLPVTISLIGIILSIIVCLLLLREQTYGHFISSLESAPWIVLVGGILISLLIAALLRIVYENREHQISLKVLDENYQREIIERLEIEESKLELEKAFLQGQKLQAIGTLAGGIAHDFNNILYAINGYVSLAREDLSPESVTYKNLGKVLEASHRGQDLIARILAFSRRQHHELKLTPLKETIESVLALLTPTVPSSVRIDFIAENANCTVMGNSTQLHQVIVNIINNAVDAMDGEGLITIHLSKVMKNDPLLKQLHKKNDHNYCMIKITDTGHGMDQHTLDRIFEPFFTTKEVGKGTGLGLSTVHAIIEEHHGEITADSQLGQGTTFTILLPEASP
jgi:signal transduction histidine kinase